MRLLLALLLGTSLLAGGTAADLARSIREISLDPGECYRIRELTVAREDIRIYLTDGYLMFAKPVEGRRVAAVFSADVDGGDAEILVMPPNRGERRSLAAYTGSPNLSEHFSGGVLIFSDDTWQELTSQIRAGSFSRKVPEISVLAGEWATVLRNIAASYETRLALDLLSGMPPRDGFFGAALTGRKLGNFDVLYDPRVDEQVILGQVAASRDNRAYFDVWTSFQARSYRKDSPRLDHEFTVRDYRIDATVEPDLNLRVTARVKVAPSGVAQRVLPFDLTRGMRVESAAIDGRPAEVLQRDSLRANLVRGSGNDLILVVPAEPLPPGREYELEIREQGRVIHDAGNQVYFVGARANWYPNRRMQFATYDLTFRHPATLDLVMPGTVVEEKTEGEWRITRRRTAAPIRFAGFNLGHYDRAKVTRGRYTVEVCANQTFEQALQARPREPIIVISPQFPSVQRGPRRPDIIVPPEPPPDTGHRMRLQDLASDVASALEFMAARFGPPALDTLTVSPVPGTFGQGFPGLIYLSTLTYLRPQDKSVSTLTPRQQVFFTEILQAHETAHQWWGNVIASAAYRDDWLMEALANYSALLYLERRKGERTLESVLEEYRANLLARMDSGEIVDSAGPVVLGPRLESSQTPMAWRTIIYGKGSWIAHMLRRRIGDARFLEMLAELLRQYRWKPVSTEQFRALAARYLPPRSQDGDLAGFFDQWVYGTGIPALKLNYALKGKGKAQRLQGTVTQTEVDKDFSVPVPIEIHFPKARPVTHIVWTGAEPAAFSIPVPRAPTKVVLDPQWSVLRR